jgi:prepilin-type N-terminal cleavage/methylation domain-containing protein
MRRAFTLVELVMVAAILAVLSAIAVPRYSASLGHFRTEAAARRVASDISMARAQSRAGSVPRSIEFEPASGSYSIPGLAGLDGAALYRVDLSEAPYRCSMRVEFTNGTQALSFDGYGWPVGGGGEIYLAASGATRTVKIDPVTGAATVR